MAVQKTKKPVKKIATKPPPTGKNGKSLNGKGVKPSKPAPVAVALPPKTVPVPEGKSDAKLQYKAFERAIQLLNKRNYRDAREMFEKARQGPSLEIASNAQLHV